MMPDDGRLPVVVLISGSGTNLQALIDGAAGGQPFRVCAVISNRPDVPGLQRARAAGIPTEVVDHTAFSDREGFDAALGDAIDGFAAELVVLAGFMRILSNAFVERFAGRMLNIHPSLLPAFPGLHTHRRALEAGAREHGASVHFVTAELDGGPVIAQARLAVAADDTEASLGARVLAREHILLPQVVCWFAEGRLRLREGQVWFDGHPLRAPLQC
jgi:phosphoribosylglycinamide formyltransferase-1